MFQLGQQVVLVANDQCMGQARFTVTEAEDVGARCCSWSEQKPCVFSKLFFFLRLSCAKEVHVFKNLAFFNWATKLC